LPSRADVILIGGIQATCTLTETAVPRSKLQRSASALGR
jgi:hypothetical protein